MLAEKSRQSTSELVEIAGCRTEIWRGGDGARTLLLLHDSDGFVPEAAYVQALAADFSIIAPSHPGFGASDLPAWFGTVDDLAYHYLDLIEQLDLRDLLVLGISFGGWIAAELAVKGSNRLAALVLAGATGVKFEGPRVREIADPFCRPQYEVDELYYADAARFRHDYAAQDEATLQKFARNHESYAVFGWSPTLHNPKLRQRLHRIRMPTQLIWGAADRVVPQAYGQRYAAAIPGAGFEVIDGAGHFAHIERPEPFVAAVRRFAATARGE